MRIRRFLLAAAVLAAPAVLSSASPAQAGCYPQKPSTCQVQCPNGFKPVSTPTGGQACIPDLDRAEPPIQ